MRFVKKSMLVIAALAMGMSACAQDHEPLELIVFPGGFNWPIWVAEEKGIFAANQLKVNVTETPNSVFQLTHLIDGRFDVAMTAVDNVIAYREGQGATPGVGADVVAVMGGDRGFLKLVAVPEIKSIAALRGRSVSLDARTTGYAFVLFELLERGGLAESDYEIEQAGGVMQRFLALMEGKQAATLLVSPFEVQAQARGYNVLATASQALGAYQGLVAGVRSSWAEQNRARLQAYIRSYAAGVEWLYDPANRAEALGIFMKKMPQATPEMAQASYAILLDPQTGMQRRAALEPEGVQKVIELRGKWAVPQKEMGDVSRYYDPQYYEASFADR